MHLPTLVLQMAGRISDLERRLNNVMRPARVTEVDTKKALVKVAYALDENDQDVVSGWIPWSTTRAGEINKWEPPSKDEQVILLNFSGEVGPMSVVLGSMYSEKYKPPHDKGAEKRTTIRQNNDKDEPDDNLPAYISNIKADDKTAVAYSSSQDKYKNPQKKVEKSTSPTESITKATSGGVTNQHTQTPNADIYDNPGGIVERSTGNIKYAKKGGPKNTDGSTSYESAALNQSDSFEGFDGGATS